MFKQPVNDACLLFIDNLIEPNTRVLDLGCGNGKLLHHLKHSKNITGYGLEINIDNINQCVQNNIPVIHTDLNKGLSDFDSNSFDYVIMSQTLQAVKHPDALLNDMLRVGKKGIVTFPNFGYWKCRMQLGLSGKMPISNVLPDNWYETENLHLCSVKDFECLCKKLSVTIVKRTVFDHAHSTNLSMKLLPNLFGEIALYFLTK